MVLVYEQLLFSYFVLDSVKRTLIFYSQRLDCNIVNIFYVTFIKKSATYNSALKL
jgi:hypothetical protein